MVLLVVRPLLTCGPFAQGFVRAVWCLRYQLRSALVLFKHKQFSVNTHFVAIGLSAGVLRKLMSHHAIMQAVIDSDGGDGGGDSGDGGGDAGDRT